MPWDSTTSTAPTPTATRFLSRIRPTSSPRPRPSSPFSCSACWHPYLPFLGDEVTGKTIAIIGTGRIGLAMIKKCAGFDMNMLCYDPAYENHDYIEAIQETIDLRHARGISKDKNWIKYVGFESALREADFVSVHVPLLRPNESATPTYHLFNEKTLRLMKPTSFLVNDSRGPVIDELA